MIQINWLDYTVMNNPNGVMLVLAKYGYVGWLAPQSIAELHEAALMLMQRHGEPATEDLLRAHPDFDIIRSIPSLPAYQGVTGEVLPEKQPRKLNLLITGGILILAFLILK